MDIEKRKIKLQREVEDAFHFVYYGFLILLQSFKKNVLVKSDPNITTLQDLSYLAGLLQDLENLFSPDFVKFQEDTTKLVFEESPGYINKNEKIWNAWLKSRMKKIENTNLYGPVVSKIEILMSLTTNQHMENFPTVENASSKDKKKQMSRMFSRY
jgi:hypothetical protein